MYAKVATDKTSINPAWYCSNMASEVAIGAAMVGRLIFAFESLDRRTLWH